MTRRAALLLLCRAGLARAEGGVALPDGFRLDNYNAPVPDAVPGGAVIHTSALHALLYDPRVVLLDVLPAQRRPPNMQPGMPWMPLPHRDLPGSIWLPDVGRGALSPAMEQSLDRLLLQACDGDRDRPVVVYCRADCWMSWNAAKRIAQHGWANVYWYPDGPDAWERAGLPLTETEPTPIE